MISNLTPPPDPTEGHPSMYSELTASQPHHQTTSPPTHYRPSQHLGLSRPDRHKLTSPLSTFLPHRADEISALTCTTPNAASGRSVPSVLYGANTGVNERIYCHATGKSYISAVEHVVRHRCRHIHTPCYRLRREKRAATSLTNTFSYTLASRISH
jgi:hypothetical protein